MTEHRNLFGVIESLKMKDFITGRQEKNNILSENT